MIMRKWWLLRGGLLVLGTPLISSACFVPNIVPNADKEPLIDKDFETEKNRQKDLWNRAFLDNPTGSDITGLMNQKDMDEWTKRFLESNWNNNKTRWVLATSAKETADLFDNEFMKPFLDASAKAQAKMNKAFDAVSKETELLFNNDELSSRAKEAVERYKKHGNIHSLESANETAEIFSDELSSLAREAVERYKKHG
ncbi:lipoprotein, MAG6090 family, partial [Mycoplasmopsis agalactiae]|uniref:lipoprotein, MAG6090 family n=1 Tax=Mycoplasmopsis agalactiae TaxID=2110 RepID=UPI0029620971